MMKSTGIVRKVGNLGLIVLPMELRLVNSALSTGYPERRN